MPSIHNLCERGDLRALERASLGARHSRLDERDELGRTPLFIAAFHGHTTLVDGLARLGADINAQNTNGTTPICFACHNGHLGVVRVLAARGADANHANKDGYTPFFASCLAGRLDVVRFLADELRVDMTRTNNDGCTPVYAACESGHLEVVRFLATKGLSLSRWRTDGATPLYIASQQGFTDVVRFLASRGVDLERKRHGGFTPLYVACAKGQVEVSRFLVESGVDAETPNSDGHTPFSVACHQGRLPVVRLLAHHGVCLQRRSQAGFCPLYLAAKKGHTDVVVFLLSLGVDTGLPDRFGLTPLHVAARGGHADTVRVLVESGADVGARDTNGHCPFDHAKQKGHVGVWLYLLWEQARDERCAVQCAAVEEGEWEGPEQRGENEVDGTQQQQQQRPAGAVRGTLRAVMLSKLVDDFTAVLALHALCSVVGNIRAAIGVWFSDGVDGEDQDTVRKALLWLWLADHASEPLKLLVPTHHEGAQEDMVAVFRSCLASGNPRAVMLGLRWMAVMSLRTDSAGLATSAVCTLLEVYANTTKEHKVRALALALVCDVMVVRHQHCMVALEDDSDGEGEGRGEGEGEGGKVESGRLWRALRGAVVGPDMRLAEIAVRGLSCLVLTQGARISRSQPDGVLLEGILDTLLGVYVRSEADWNSDGVSGPARANRERLMELLNTLFVTLAGQHRSVLPNLCVFVVLDAVSKGELAFGSPQAQHAPTATISKINFLRASIDASAWKLVCAGVQANLGQHLGVDATTQQVEVVLDGLL